MKNKIIELAFVRNHLLIGVFTEEDEKLIVNVKEIILNLDTPFKELALNIISNYENDVENNDLLSAAHEINLIHNFPFYNTSAWNENYFYKIEFPSYLRKANNPQRAKKLVYELAKLQDKLK